MNSEKVIEYFVEKLPGVIDFALSVILALVVFAVGAKVIGWIRKLTKRSLQRSSVDTGVAQFADSVLKFGLYALLLFSIGKKFGLDTASVAAVLASGGVAIGLALQGSLSNFAGGVIILILKPFKVGDYVIQGDLEGNVSEIQLFYTTLTTADNRKIIIPNGQLADNSLINATAAETRRIDIRVGISYNGDMKLAKEILLKIGNEDECTIKEGEKAPMAAVEELAESSVNMLLRVWAPTDRYWDTKFRLTEAVKAAFDEAKIEIPFNQLDVHLINS